MKQVALMPPEYQEMLLQADPLEMQTFTSLLDATLDIKERVHGYSRGDISGASRMFDQLLIARAPGQDHQAFTNLDPECGTSDGSDAASISAHVEAVLGVLKHTNPAVKTFKTLAEKGGGRKNSGLPLLPPRAIKDITQHAAARDPTHMGLVNSNLMSDVLSLVAAVDVVRGDTCRGEPIDGIRVGTVTVRDTDQDLDLIVNNTGLPLRSPVKSQHDFGTALSVELAIFTALFPNNKGGYCAGSFCEYLRYRMMCGFSQYTLYKPYLMVMFLIRQCNMLHSTCPNGVLEIDIKHYSQKHPDSTEEDADAPVECARLFHEKMEGAMKEWLYINGGNTPGILGRVKDYVIRHEVQDRG
ncbi:hypothetical protein CEUSTIGMA_g11776.t1 [Chlamydomonas eustigma]|uniref:Uncharacterized protein n=1 Tax=Chlamydomonas eustigma TaxID=1157962 RepID=A0A250XMP1_9CHLO|nr:hypothetical protein CEUSTIGMA_g11776.t1 [Chlamydomonas eustigma]|eukprot:GAX84354.1 hypothetical protein CEUSTIGMA_g11776.t1 [Chlamydomonas eustigma]